MDDIYQSIKECSPNKNLKILIFRDDIFADRLSNKTLNPTVTKLFITELFIRKLNICLAFITQSYFNVPKNIRLSYTHYIIIKIPNKREFQQIAFNHSSGIEFKNIMNLYKKHVIQNHILF